jgi:dipicolinate synthase subunit A
MSYNFVIDCSDQRNNYLYSELGKEFYTQKFGGNLYFDKPGVYVYVFAPSAVLDDIAINKIKDGSVVFCLSYDQKTRERLSEKNVRVYKLFDDELLAVKNAGLTAEGTLSAVIENTAVGLKELNVLVLGFGRVGKSVTKLFCDCKSRVGVATKDKIEYAAAHLFTDDVIHTDEIIKRAGGYNVIINTIPILILNGETLKNISKECLIIDLASMPGGVDFNQARLLGLNAMHLLGVPGKYAPETSGKHIKQSIFGTLGIS